MTKSRQTNAGTNARKFSKRCRASYEKLETRHLLASIYHNPSNGILYITGDSGANVGQVNVSNGDVVAEIDGIPFSAAASSVADIVFVGYAGNDTFTNLSSRASTMYGHLGDDTLNGGSGDDNLVGGAGNDTIKGNAGNDRIVGANGNDNLEGGSGNDRMFGTAGLNTISGGTGDDTITGSPLADEIHGNAGVDKIYALGGDDTIFTGAGGQVGGSFAEGDLAMGHDGNDQIFGESGLDIFYGGNGNDELVGGSGENRMHGQGDDDTLTGGPLADYMTGANGDDSFNGGGGVDSYNVGNGTDTIIYSTNFTPSDVTVVQSGGQTLTRVQNEVVSNASVVQFADRTMSPNQALYESRDEIHYDRVNSYRNSNQLPLFSKPTDLANFARNWSLEMARQNTLFHSSENARRALLTGGRTVVGENVAFVSDIGQTEAEIANYFFNDWRTSAVHNRNMLLPDFHEFGIGIVRSGGFWWATQVFTG